MKLNIIILAGGRGSGLKGIRGHTKSISKDNSIPFVEYLEKWIDLKTKDIEKR